MALLGGVLVAGIGAVAVVWWRSTRRRRPRRSSTLDMALAALDHGDWQEARRLAERLEEQGGLCTGAMGRTGLCAWEPSPFIEAEQSLNKQKRSGYLAGGAIPGRGPPSGLPADREARGLYLLGKSLYFAAGCRRVARS